MARPCRREGPEPCGSFPLTDTTGMQRIAANVFRSSIVVLLVGTSAVAGEAFRCRDCGPGYGGMATPYGDTGCGPRYWGAVHDEPNCPDPCDACNRWRDCTGRSRSNDVLTPWQLPPGRGFMPPEQFGYDTSSGCEQCRSHGRCGARR
jgi:hypothetical protein